MYKTFAMRAYGLSAGLAVVLCRKLPLQGSCFFLILEGRGVRKVSKFKAEEKGQHRHVESVRMP